MTYDRTEWPKAFNEVYRKREVARCDGKLAGLEACALAKAYRESLGLSARRFAYQIETDPSNYARFESGKYQPVIAKRVGMHARGEI